MHAFTKKLIDESSVQMLCELKVGRLFLQVDVDNKLYRPFLCEKTLFKAKSGDLVPIVKALLKGKFAKNACEDFDQVSAMVRVLSKSVASSCRLLGEWARAVLRTSRPSPGDSVS